VLKFKRKFQHQRVKGQLKQAVSMLNQPPHNEAYREHSTILHILSLHTARRCVASFMPQVYTNGEKTSSNQSTGGRLRGKGVQGQSQHSSEKQKNPCNCCELMRNLEFHEISIYDLDLQYAKC
jgi:hypothetical protein